MKRIPSFHRGADEVGIRIRLGTETVMHVGACEGDAQRRSQLPEHVEKRHGVRAAGGRRRDNIPAENQPVALNRRENLGRGRGEY
jgi:hypothetical protein